VGWSEAEMTALGHDFAARGRRFEEMLAVLRRCWTGRTEEFHGETLDVPGGLVFMPRPVTGGLPLLLGGMSPVAVRRAAALGDGWLAIGFVDDWDPAGLAERLKEFRFRWHDLGRDGEPRAVLKLHCATGFDRLRACARWALRAGFDEVMIDLPWSRGLDAAARTFASVAGPGPS
jgi:alkanesulfonate monooxygenase SsuD/methylene tetrahydromethanopterin reductase-like flavin-dependent oxidoreductase (luciferase family)